MSPRCYSPIFWILVISIASEGYPKYSPKDSPGQCSLQRKRRQNRNSRLIGNLLITYLGVVEQPPLQDRRRDCFAAARLAITSGAGTAPSRTDTTLGTRQPKRGY